MLDPTSLLHSAGYLGVALLLFAETGLLIGFFLPGDSLLITAGILAAAGQLSLPGIMASAFVGAVIGDTTGYLIGQRFGPSVFSRQNSRLFRPEYLDRTNAFFARHGRAAVILARFVPVVRTVIPTLAGTGRMHYATFLAFNVIGAALWAILVPLAGDLLGRLIPHLDRYILAVVAVVVVLSLIPVLTEIRRIRRQD
ncbi:DedA family protein [Deinococcus sp.]|uniref:DedA family protein n=1 Tax=Deinococcus sp. TaxID=47478 RepID=UPI003C7E07DE